MNEEFRFDLERRKLETTKALKERAGIIAKAKAEYDELDKALSAINLALGTIGHGSSVVELARPAPSPAGKRA